MNIIRCVICNTSCDGDKCGCCDSNICYSCNGFMIHKFGKSADGKPLFCYDVENFREDVGTCFCEDKFIDLCILNPTFTVRECFKKYFDISRKNHIESALRQKKHNEERLLDEKKKLQEQINELNRRLTNDI